ncbi:hypothetical protein DOJK_00166 [Patescibacteria group bacterium]|nr:hypothetical protein DOJK_00166 [Patescibacteria group bacterium]
MSIEILITVLIVAAVQSIFGVGMLLFGTPILLLLGYSFVETLGVVLPVSIAISLLQVVKHYDHVDVAFYKKVLRYSIPVVILFLVLITSIKVNIGIIMGIFLLLVAIKNFSHTIERALQSVVKYERLYLIITGLVHGISNLGGSLLTVMIYSKQYPKDVTRVTMAACYSTLALFQLLTLLVMHTEFTIPYSDKVTLVQVGILTFLIVEEVLYVHIDNEKFNRIFAVFLFAAGLGLIGKSML